MTLTPLNPTHSYIVPIESLYNPYIIPSDMSLCVFPEQWICFFRLHESTACHEVMREKAFSSMVMVIVLIAKIMAIIVILIIILKRQKP